MSEADDIQAIQERMRKVRRELGSDLASSARDMTDWRWLLRANPLICLGAAAAVGYLLAPKGPSVVRLSDLDLQALMRNDKATVTAKVQPRPSSSGRLTKLLISNLAGLVMKGAMAYVGHQIASAQKASQPKEDAPY